MRKGGPFAHGASLSRRVWLDRAARAAFAFGAALVALAGIGLFVFLVVAVVPVLLPARVDLLGETRNSHASSLVGALGLDESETLIILDGESRLRRITRDGELLEGPPLFDAPRTGRTRLLVDDERRLIARLGESGRLVLRLMGPGGRPGRLLQADLAEDVDLEGPLAISFAPEVDEVLLAGRTSSDRLVFVRRRLGRHGRLTEPPAGRFVIPLPGASPVSALAVDPSTQRVFGGTSRGGLFVWTPGQAAPRWSGPSSASVTALSVFPGSRALVAGHADGTISFFFASQSGRGASVLREYGKISRRGPAIQVLRARGSDRTFAALDAAGGVVLANATSRRVLWRESTAKGAFVDVVFGSGHLALVGSRETRLASLDLRHPELTFSTIFMPTRYEGYSRPEHIWQSRGGSRGYEPKLGVLPLIFGTLKGAAYALAFALPIGILAALYVSQFMKPALRSIVKPSMELLAAFPTVVLGFLAGIWLAPRLVHAIPSLLLATAIVPCATLLGGWAWLRTPRWLRGRATAVGEFVCIFGALTTGLALSLALGRWAWPLVSSSVHGSILAEWLLAYEQRNGIVVGLAMGVAVVPLVFTVAEEAFSSVPGSLISGSLALGADSWRTVRGIVIPAAAPGVLAASLLGLSRAVGETMIVLMASGNAPLMDPGPTTGFRSITATVAMEIQEADPSSSLYVTLLLVSLLLLVGTSVLNVGAEFVRSRLRRRIGALEEV